MCPRLVDDLLMQDWSERLFALACFALVVSMDIGVLYLLSANGLQRLVSFPHHLSNFHDDPSVDQFFNFNYQILTIQETY